VFTLDRVLLDLEVAAVQCLQTAAACCVFQARGLKECWDVKRSNIKPLAMPRTAIICHGWKYKYQRYDDKNSDLIRIEDSIKTFLEPAMTFFQILSIQVDNFLTDPADKKPAAQHTKAAD
jgi:hypothetical protein